MWIMGLIKKFCSWPTSKDPEPSDFLDWQAGEREQFYKNLNARQYYNAFCIIRTKATRNSLEEMGHLMLAFEQDLMGKPFQVEDKNEIEKE